MRSMRMVLSAYTASLAAIAAIAVACSSTPSGDAVVAACQNLLSCCGKLATGQAGCIQIAGANDPASCSDELVALQSGGTCGAATFTTSSGTTVTSQNPCASLASCCALMSGATQEACDATAQQGAATECGTVLSAYEAAGSCSPAGSGTGTGTVTSTFGSTGTATGGTSTGTTGINSTTGNNTGTGTGSSTTSGTGGAMCPMSCTADVECQLDCPAVPGAIHCCDTSTALCYATGSATCPTPVTGTDAGAGY